MAQPPLATQLDYSNQQLIESLNSRQYLNASMPGVANNPLYQNIISQQSSGLDTLIAQGRASSAFAYGAEKQNELDNIRKAKELGLVAGLTLLAPGAGTLVGMGINHFAGDFLWGEDPYEIYSKADYTKAAMAGAMRENMMNQMGSIFMGGDLSMEQATSLSDDMYGFMRQRGFQGLELTRMMPALSESGLLSPTGRFGDAEEALSQFEDRIKGFVDKIADTVRTTSMDIETATALSITETRLSGSRDVAQGFDYMESVQLLGSYAGMDIGQANMAMQQSVGAWGETTFDRRGIAEATAYTVAGASVAASSGGAWDAAWMNVGEEKFGFTIAQRSNQQWASHGGRRDLARLYANGATPGTEEWNNLVAGEGFSSGFGSYAGIGTREERLEAEFYGMQMAAENPNMMAAASIGMVVEQMSDRGVDSREAQIMYMVDEGWGFSEAAASLDWWDQQRTGEGQARTYIDTRYRQQDIALERIGDDAADVLLAAASLSQEHNAYRQQAVRSSLYNEVIAGDVTGVAGRIIENDDIDRLDSSVGNAITMEQIAGGELDRYSVSTAVSGMSAVIQREHGVLGMGGRGVAAEAAMQTIWENPALSGEAAEDPSQQLAILKKLKINRGGAQSDISVFWRIKEVAGLALGKENVSDAEVLRYIENYGGSEYISNFMIDGRRVESYVKGEVSGASIDIRGGGLEMTQFISGYSEAMQDLIEEDRAEYGELDRIWSAGFQGGEAESKALELAISGGYFENIEAVNVDKFNAVNQTMNAMAFLGGVPEERQYYATDRDHMSEYGDLLGALTEKGYGFSEAIEGLDPNNLEDQMAARDNLSQAGYGKSYQNLTQQERNYIEEVFYSNETNESTRSWAGRHDDLIEEGWESANTAAASGVFGGWGEGEEYAQAMEKATWATGATQTQIELIAQRRSLMLGGADADLIKEVESKIGDAEAIAQAEKAFILWSGESNLNERDAIGTLMSADLQAKIMGEIPEATQNEYNAILQAILSDDATSIADLKVIEGTEIEKWASGEISFSDLTVKMGSEIPGYTPADASTRDLLAVPEFQDAPLRIVEPAGGAMPVYMVSDDTKESAENFRASAVTEAEE